MNRYFINLFLSAVCMFSIANTSYAQSSHDVMEREILDLVNQYKAIGLSIAVVKDSEIIYTKSFGKQNIESGISLADDHIFRIASISKSFTATGIMQMIEAGKFTLDTDFSELLGFPVRNPNFPEKPITLQMVLSHTSSINDSQGYFTFDRIDPSKNPDWAKCYNNYEPGSRYQYCNLNFNMAGAVLERFSGERFDEYIAKHILRPLGLYGGYRIDALDSSKFASIYTYDLGEGTFNEAIDAYHPRREEMKNYKMGFSTPIFSPTGGLKISAPHLARYMIMHMNYGIYDGTRIIQETSAKEMQKAVLETSGYGLALKNTSTYIPGEKMVGHTGSAYGLYSNMFFSPEKKFGFVLITNGFAPLKNNDEIDLDILEKSARVLHKYLVKD